MISFVKGILVETAPERVVVETGGIGYAILIPVSAHGKLPRNGETIQLYTSLVIREDAHLLYGFPSVEERRLFEQLTSVSGIGPKIALSLIGHMSPQQLYKAVSEHDIAGISRVPGIGKKTAERLILEMRDKLSKGFKGHLPSEFAIALDGDPFAQKRADAMNALIHLGYNYAVADNAIKKSLKNLPESIDLAELITHALKNV